MEGWSALPCTLYTLPYSGSSRDTTSQLPPLGREHKSWCSKILVLLNFAMVWGLWLYFYKYVIEANIITEADERETVFILQIPLNPSDYHLNFKDVQFPNKYGSPSNHPRNNWTQPRVGVKALNPEE